MLNAKKLDKITKGEHNAFLLFWMYKYFAYTSFI